MIYNRFVVCGDSYSEGMSDEMVGDLYRGWADRVADEMAKHSDTFTGGPAWFLDDLFTVPAARGHGVATALIAALRAHADANGGGTISWITADDNLTAQSVYNKIAKRAGWVTYELDE